MSILDHEGMGTNEINPEVVIAAKSYYIQLGDAPLGITQRITSVQTKQDLGITKPTQIGCIIQGISGDVTFFLLNPQDHSTTSNSALANSYREIFGHVDSTGFQQVSMLPNLLPSNTTIVCIYTNGNVAAILIKDKALPKKD